MYFFIDYLVGEVVKNGVHPGFIILEHGDFFVIMALIVLPLLFKNAKICSQLLVSAAPSLHPKLRQHVSDADS